LMAADQEDEDLLGDLMGDGMDDGDDNFDDEDILDSDDEGDAGPGGDQVVLEGGDDDWTDEDGSGSSDKLWKKWVKSKLVIATASAILVLGISVPIVYFLFFSQAPVQIPEKMPVQVVMEAPGRDIEVASVDINVTEAMDFKKSGNIILSDFVVLASDLSKDMAYVTADISIDYSDQRAYREINDNLSFYRDLIYESIQKNLIGEKGNEVTEADLIWGIETSLKKVFPSDYIEKVSFKSFKAS
jgi:flagellar basal body-associated protein FliL